MLGISLYFTCSTSAAPQTRAPENLTIHSTPTCLQQHIARKSECMLPGFVLWVPSVLADGGNNMLVDVKSSILHVEG